MPRCHSCTSSRQFVLSQHQSTLRYPSTAFDIPSFYPENTLSHRSLILSLRLPTSFKLIITPCPRQRFTRFAPRKLDQFISPVTFHKDG
eukprot:388771-Hanusia_phi.AAC.1